jgi:pyridoxal phosphate enzyme (YggS family)
VTDRRQEIARRLDAVRERIVRAETAAGRPPGAVTLIAVSKTMPPEDVAAAIGCGQLDFGENYAQELRDKRAALAQLGHAPRWHYIGPLQSNKAKYVAGQVALLHSVDDAELLAELERRLPPAAGPQECLVQVNVATEAGKRGVSVEQLPGLLDAFAARPRLRCVGLMVIPPFVENPETGRAHFAALRVLRDREAARPRPQVELRELSMGMSHDLEVAIAEGATLVRVGTAIFGERRRKQ